MIESLIGSHNFSALSTGYCYKFFGSSVAKEIRLHLAPNCLSNRNVPDSIPVFLDWLVKRLSVTFEWSQILSVYPRQFLLHATRTDKGLYNRDCQTNIYLLEAIDWSVVGQHNLKLYTKQCKRERRNTRTRYECHWPCSIYKSLLCIILHTIVEE